MFSVARATVLRVWPAYEIALMPAPLPVDHCYERLEHCEQPETFEAHNDKIDILCDREPDVNAI